MAFKIVSYPNAQPIDETSTTKRHPLGTKVVAVDPDYGESEFVYLKGVASTAVGDCVAYDQKNGDTTRTVAATRGSLAVAMSANVANQYGWYCVRGACQVSGLANCAADAPLAVTATAGALDDTVAAGSGVSGITLVDAIGGAPALAWAQLSYPSANGLA